MNGWLHYLTWLQTKRLSLMNAASDSLSVIAWLTLTNINCLKLRNTEVPSKLNLAMII